MDPELLGLWAAIRELAYRMIRLEHALAEIAPEALARADVSATQYFLGRVGLQRLDDVGLPPLEETKP